MKERAIVSSVEVGNLRRALRELLEASLVVAWCEDSFKEDDERYRAACAAAEKLLEES